MHYSVNTFEELDKLMAKENDTCHVLDHNLTFIMRNGAWKTTNISLNKIDLKERLYKFLGDLQTPDGFKWLDKLNKQ